MKPEKILTRCFSVPEEDKASIIQYNNLDGQLSQIDDGKLPTGLGTSVQCGHEMVKISPDFNVNKINHADNMSESAELEVENIVGTAPEE